VGECLILKDNVFPQYLLFSELAHRAAEKINLSIVPGDGHREALRAILAPYDAVGTTRHVEFDTTRATWATRADKCPVSHVVLDSDWEAKFAQALEEMPEVAAYVKNDHLAFTIPYAAAGRERQYLPDYLVRLDDGRGPADLLNLVVEVTGDKDPDKEAKVATARDLWVPAVNHEGAFGRWAFYEVRDPWNAKRELRQFLAGNRVESVQRGAAT
jgi:type III restriction enzyme